MSAQNVTKRLLSFMRFLRNANEKPGFMTEQEMLLVIERYVKELDEETRTTDPTMEVTHSAERSIVVEAPEPTNVFEVRVPNHDDGESMGVFESAYLPVVGQRMLLWHPTVTGKGDDPFECLVEDVTWDLKHKSHKYAGNENSAEIIVWVTEFAAAPTLYCTCSEEELKQWPGLDRQGHCENCGRERP